MISNCAIKISEVYFVEVGTEGNPHTKNSLHEGEDKEEDEAYDLAFHQRMKGEKVEVNYLVETVLGKDLDDTSNEQEGNLEDSWQ